MSLDKKGKSHHRISVHLVEKTQLDATTRRYITSKKWCITLADRSGNKTVKEFYLNSESEKEKETASLVNTLKQVRDWFVWKSNEPFQTHS